METLQKDNLNLNLKAFSQILNHSSDLANSKLQLCKTERQLNQLHFFQFKVKKCNLNKCNHNFLAKWRTISKKFSKSKIVFEQ